MWTSTRRTRAAHATRSRQVGVAVALLACVGLAACTAAETPSPASTTEADTIAPFPASGVLDAGTYLVTRYPVPFEITVPDGWESRRRGPEEGRRMTRLKGRLPDFLACLLRADGRMRLAGRARPGRSDG